MSAPTVLTLAESVADLSPEAEAWETRLIHSAGQDIPKVIPAREALGFLIGYLKFRASRKFDGVVVVTGDEGVGKSTLALRIAQGLNPAFPMSDLCYTASEVLGAYQRARRGQPFVYDEGVRGLLAGETFSPEQVALVKALTLVRSSGAVLLICIPSIHMLSKQIRARRATLWVHVSSRGRGTVFVRDHRLKFKDKGDLNMTGWATCPKVTWKPYSVLSRLWRDYEVKKEKEKQAFLREAQTGLGPEGETRADRKRRMARLRQQRKRERESAEGDVTPSLDISGEDSTIR